MKIKFPLLFLAFFSMLQTLHSECIVPGEHESFAYFLVDRSDKLTDKEGFTKTVNALTAMLTPGERLIVGLSTEKASSTKILMDYVKPKPSVWDSMLKTRAETKKFNECLQTITQSLTATEEEHKHSALLETLAFVSKIFANETTKTKRFFLYSDMMQNSDSISFYNFKPFDPEKALVLTEKTYLLSKFPDVQVFVAGTGVTVSDDLSRKLEAYWDAFFTKTGAALKYYGPILISS